MKKICIIGGGAAGLSCGVFLARKGFDVTVLERGERLGRKLSATGNGQGNVSNADMGISHYFSDDLKKAEAVLSRFGTAETVAFLESMGGLFFPDGRGRVYPASKQASAVTDLFRKEIARLGVNVIFKAHVCDIAYDGNFTVRWADGHMNADAVVLCAGGRAAPSFGTDGSAYALAQKFDHTLVPQKPALVQLRCEKDDIRGLKGVRVDANLKVVRKGKEIYASRGDVLFTDTGVSGDAVFRASSYVQEGDRLFIDFLPEVSSERLAGAVRDGEDGLLCIVNNAVARVLYKRAKNQKELLALVKAYPLTVTGTLGFAYAQVTRGGVPLSETTEQLESKFRSGLYFAGEILNVDGECGGYNLQWAFSSAYTVACAIAEGSL